LVFLINLPLDIFEVMQKSSPEMDDGNTYSCAIRFPYEDIFRAELYCHSFACLSDIAGQIAGAKLRKIDMNRSIRATE